MANKLARFFVSIFSFLGTSILGKNLTISFLITRFPFFFCCPDYTLFWASKKDVNFVTKFTSIQTELCYKFHISLNLNMSFCISYLLNIKFSSFDVSENSLFIADNNFSSFIKVS